MTVRRKVKKQFGGKLQVYRSRAAMQRGYGNYPMFSGQGLQQGRGFGSLFRGLMKTIAPIAKRGLLSVGKAALNAGARAMEDVRDNNTSVKQALKKQAVTTFHPQNVINRALKKRKATSQPQKPKRKVQRKGKVVKGTLDAPRFTR